MTASPSHWGVVVVTDATDSHKTQPRPPTRAESGDLDFRASLLDSLAEAVFATDEDLVIRYVNSSAARLLGETSEALVGTSLGTVLSARSSRRLLTEFASCQLDGSCMLRLDAASRKGTPIRVELQMEPSPNGGCRTGVLRDVSVLRARGTSLEELSGHDPLTGLMNRRSFIHEVEGRLADAAGTGEPGAIILLDLDHFKALNDILGYQHGDAVLVRAAQAMRDVAPAGAQVARMSGDGFAMYAPSLDKGEVSDLSERLLQSISAITVHEEDGLVHVTGSVGAALFPNHGNAIAELLGSAEESVRRAKQTGGNRTGMVDPAEDWRGEAARVHTWIDRVLSASREGRLVPYAQPIRKSGEPAVRKFELLVRMIEEDGESILPDHFLDVLEYGGMSLELDLLMLRSACELIAGFADAGLQLNVNMTPASFVDPDMPARVQEIISETEIVPGALGIEITEKAVVSDIRAARAALEGFRDLGCRIVLDDFGSGFSSFFHLRSLPFDELKIDGFYIVDILTREQDVHFVTAMVTLAAGLEMETTAEFVVSDEQIEVLAELGVDYCQGHAVGRPGPAWELVSATLA